MPSIRRIATIAPIVAVLTLGTAVPAVHAGDDDVRVTGSCTGSSSSKLKLSEEDGGIETEFEVDQNVVGRRWRVAVFHDGARVLRRVAVTTAPSGSFEVRTVVDDSPGTDRVRARAVDLRSGEVCRAVASW